MKRKPEFAIFKLTNHNKCSKLATVWDQLELATTSKVLRSFQIKEAKIRLITIFLIHKLQLNKIMSIFAVLLLFLWNNTGSIARNMARFRMRV